MGTMFHLKFRYVRKVEPLTVAAVVQLWSDAAKDFDSHHTIRRMILNSTLEHVGMQHGCARPIWHHVQLQYCYIAYQIYFQAEPVPFAYLNQA